jgi:hypothetical protein
VSIVALDERTVTLPVSGDVVIVKESDGYSEKSFRQALKRSTRVTDCIPDYLAALVKSVNGKGGVTKSDILGMLFYDSRFLTIEAYRVGYGDEFTFQNVCASCGAVNKHMVDLSTLHLEPLPKGSSGGKDPLFDLTLPRCKKKCKIGYNDGHKEKIISDAIAASGVYDGNQGDYLAVRQLEGCDPVTYEDIIKLAGRDHKAIRDKQKAITCGYDTSVVVSCESCGAKDLVDITMSRDFLFPGG